MYDDELENCKTTAYTLLDTQSGLAFDYTSNASDAAQSLRMCGTNQRYDARYMQYKQIGLLNNPLTIILN